jgi:hypothetical protein
MKHLTSKFRRSAALLLTLDDSGAWLQDSLKGFIRFTGPGRPGKSCPSSFTKTLKYDRVLWLNTIED